MRTKKKKQQSMKLGDVEANLDGLRNEPRKEIVEPKEGNKLPEQLVQQVNLNGTELTKKISS